MELTTANIIKAIERCNAASSYELRRHMTTIKSKRATQTEIVGQGVHPYCENLALSLSVSGKIYNAVKAPPGIETIPAAARSELLDTRACFYDLDPAMRPDTKALRKAFGRAIEKQGEFREIYFREDLDSVESVSGGQ